MGASETAENGQSTIAAIDWFASVKYGAGAWVGGYLALFVSMEALGVVETLGDTSTPDAVAFVLFSGSLGAGKEEVRRAFAVNSVSSITYGEGLIYPAADLLEFLVPLVMLVLAGWLVAGKYTDHDRYTALLAGASVAGGYFAALVVITYVSLLLPAWKTWYSPFGMIVAGMLYPALFGSLGAAVRTGPQLGLTPREKYGAGAYLVGLTAWSVIQIAILGPSIKFLRIVPMEYAMYHGAFYPVFLYVEVPFTRAPLLPGIVTFWPPVVFPFAAGFLIVRRAAQPATVSEAVFDGATVVRGYAIMVTASVLYHLAYLAIVTADVRGSAIEYVGLLVGAIPATLFVILFTGIVWPVVLGSLGGIVAHCKLKTIAGLKLRQIVPRVTNTENS